MTFNEADVNRKEDGKFGEKTGWPPEVGLAPSAPVLCFRHGGVWGKDETCAECTNPDGTPVSTEGCVSCYDFHGRFMGENELRDALGIDANADLDKAIQDHAVEAGVDLSEEHNSFDAPVRYIDEQLPMPSESEGVELDHIDLGLDEDKLQHPYARLTDGGNIMFSATYYENLLWNDEFTEEELDRAAPLVEDFFRERFGAELIDGADGWDGVELEFHCEYEPKKYGAMVIANTFDDRSNFGRFVNESDPGTYGSPYAYADLRKQIDAGDFVENRWTTMSDSTRVDASRVASALPPGGVPTDAEALAMARSLAYEGWSGPGQDEVRRLAESGWTKDVNSVREGLLRTAESTKDGDIQNRAATLLAWLDRNDN